MGAFEYSVRIAATPAEVWRTYVDPDRIPKWQTGRPVIEQVQGEPGEPGSTYVSKRGPLRARTEVLTSSPPTRLLTRTHAYLGLQFEVTSQLTERSGGTDLQLTVGTVWPPGRRLLGRLIERAVLSSREAAKELQNLRTIIERSVTD